MTAQPLWTILIPTIGRRQAQFKRLAIELLAQAEPRLGQVTILAYYNNGERPLAEIRQALVEAATSAYVSFVDDDDWVPDYYVEKVALAIEGHAAEAGLIFGATGHWPQGLLPDYVGWRMQHYSDGVPSKPTYHSLAYGRWYDDERGYYRDVSHLNPILRSKALLADFRGGSPPEDVSWADQMRGLLQTEVVIDPEFVMYHYYSSGDSTWRPGSVKTIGTERRAQIAHPLFAWHPDGTS